MTLKKKKDKNKSIKGTQLKVIKSTHAVQERMPLKLSVHAESLQSGKSNAKSFYFSDYKKALTYHYMII